MFIKTAYSIVLSSRRIAEVEIYPSVSASVMRPDEKICFWVKLLAHYAAEAAKATDSRREAATLNALSIDCQSGQSAVLRAFDDICKISDYCRGERRVGDQVRPEHAVNMSSRWEELTSEAVENF